ncbi:MAG TPA: DNA repair protein RecN [Acidimicrobiales bacterium]|nr:DNA repair protein RecN [Acidimicrobiales bacterium]
MLSELRVSQLGVIEDLTLVLGLGMTALTGETGAGKTLVVEAIELLLGGRAEGGLVRPGAAEALVEGRFVLPAALGPARTPAEGTPAEGTSAASAPDAEEAIEVVLSRAVPAEGRSRAYLDGRMASVGALAELGERLVDLHGQHAHQSLLSGAAQRDALDSYAGADRRPREAARAALREIDEALARAGRDGAGRSGEMELLRYQLAELSAAQIGNPAEDTELEVEEERLGKAAAHRAAAEAVYEDLSGDEQVLDLVGKAVARIAAHPPLVALRERLKSVAAELADLASEARATAEGLEEDPERLAEVVSRRALLHELRRKYVGPGGSLADVLAFQEDANKRLEELDGLEGLSAQLAEERAQVLAKLRRAAGELGDARRAASTALGEGVQSGLRRLAIPRGRFEVRVGAPHHDGVNEGAGEETDDLRELSGEDVTFLLAANPGEPLMPLSKVASGGELARAMLALRLVLVGGPQQHASGANGAVQGPLALVFDEVDAGVGGEAALAVGRALADLGRRYQVIVVTHLAQVAAFADAQIAVSKVERDGRSVALAAAVSGPDRVIELSRMLSGQPDSATARRHAEELLETARLGRDRAPGDEPAD